MKSYGIETVGEITKGNLLSNSLFTYWSQAPWIGTLETKINLVPNGDELLGASGTTPPTNWTTTHTNSYAYDDTTSSLAGTLEVSYSTWANPDLNQTVNVTSGNTYRFSGYMYLAGGDRTEMIVNGDAILADSGEHSVVGEWCHFSRMITADQSTIDITLRVYGGVSAQANFKDIKLEEISTNTIVNGTHWTGAVASTPPTGWLNDTGPAAIFNHVSGANSGNGLSMQFDEAYSDSTSDSCCSQVLSMDPGKTYRVSGYMKGDAQLAIWAGWLLVDWKTTKAQGDEWQYFSQTFTNFFFGEIYMMVDRDIDENPLYDPEDPLPGIEPGTHKTGYFDDIRFEEVNPGHVGSDEGVFPYTDEELGIIQNWTGIHTLGPDGWSKTNTLRITRQLSTVEGGIHSVKLIKGSDNPESLNQLFTSRFEYIQRIAGRILTFGAYVKTDVADNIKIAFHVNIRNEDNFLVESPYHSGSGEWEWLEVSYQMPSSPGPYDANKLNDLWEVSFKILTYGLAGSEGEITQCIVIMGSIIGEGNYVPAYNDKPLPWPHTDIDGKGVTLSGRNKKTFSNLLGNSSFGVWSSSTLKEVPNAPDQAVSTTGTPLWVNAGYSTFIPDWPSGIMQAATTASGTTVFCNMPFNSIYNRIYKMNVVIYGSGELPSISITDGSLNGVRGLELTELVNGIGGNEFIFRSIGGSNVQIRNTNPSNWQLQISIIEVTPSNNLNDETPGATNRVCDGWVKSGDAPVYRSGGGSIYDIIHIQGSAREDEYTDNYMYWPRNADRGLSSGRDAVSFGCFVKTDVADHVMLRLNTDTTYDAFSRFHSGSGEWEWLEVTTGWAFGRAYIHFMKPGITNKVTIRKPMMILGSEIGAGNYSRPYNEIIWFDKKVETSNFNGVTVDANIAISTAAESLGKIPTYYGALHTTLKGKCSTLGGIANFGNCVTIVSHSSTVLSISSGWSTTTTLSVDNTFTDLEVTYNGIQLK